jgi:hypothetical protein
MLTLDEMRALSAFVDVHFAKSFGRWLSEAGEVAEYPLSYTIGKKYIRLVCNGQRFSLRSVYGFIDKSGNVLKAATWARPAKHARGSIYNLGNPADGAGKWGVLYMDEVKNDNL